MNMNLSSEHSTPSNPSNIAYKISHKKGDKNENYL